MACFYKYSGIRADTLRSSRTIGQAPIGGYRRMKRPEREDALL
jgi:hypothetical protein